MIAGNVTTKEENLELINIIKLSLVANRARFLAKKQKLIEKSEGL